MAAKALARLAARAQSFVMPGLDPGIHAISSQQVSANGMDCRVKPGNDEECAGCR
jgi:hypothetical protein